MVAQSDIDQRLIREALRWQASLERDDADWDGYMLWLEADPGHRAAFDFVALTERAVDEHRGSLNGLLDPPSTVSVAPARRRWLWAGGAAVAAALALAVGLPMMRSEDPVSTYAASPRASRAVALANGTHILLSPASRVIVRGKDADRIELASGEAYFTVRHDPARALTVAAGPYSISDIGTRFSVNHSGSSFRVAVSEGTVSVASDRAEGFIRLSAGQQLTSGKGLIPTLAKVSPADVGSWRDGRLSYADAPLSLVVADISRYSGRQIIVDPLLENRHFSGTLVIGDGSGLVHDLASVMGLAARPQHDGVIRLDGAAR